MVVGWLSAGYRLVIGWLSEMEQEVRYGFVIRGEGRRTLLPPLRHATAQPLSRLQCHTRCLRGMRRICPTLCAMWCAYRANCHAWD